MADGAWSDAENDQIVDAYFGMLCDELKGVSFVKADVRRTLESRIGRSKRSIEFKNMNISAVLMGMGQPWIEGYKPATQFQLSLVDAVVRWIDRHPNWAAELHHRSPLGVSAVAERPPLWIGPSPLKRNEPLAIDPERLEFVARRFDVANRDARNRALGEAGEALVIESEKQSLRAANRQDLADRVVWIARDQGDGAGYDIASFEQSGAPRLIEVKTTNGWEYTPFHISRNEIACSQERRASWVLLRLWNFAKEPRAFELRPPLEDHVSLIPTSFLASPL